MKPIFIAALVLLALTLCFAVVGTLLARFHLLRARNAPSYTRVCTLMVLSATYCMSEFDWPGVHLRPLDFWSLMVIAGIVSYALIWAPLAHQLNQKNHDEFAESFMLSMLYHDTEQVAPPPPPELGRRKP